MTPFRSFLLASLFLVPGVPLAAADAREKPATGPVSYYKEVRRLFQYHGAGPTVRSSCCRMLVRFGVGMRRERADG